MSDMTVESDMTIEFEGERFRVSEKVGLMPLMRFAHVARSGADSEDMEGLAAMYDLLAQVIADDDWERFQAHATKVRAGGEALMAVIPAAVKVLTARPTELPSDSSGGQKRMSENSADDSSSPVISRLEREGRPDLALMVSRARVSTRSA